MEKYNPDDFAKPGTENPHIKEEEKGQVIAKLKETVSRKFANTPEEFLNKGLYANTNFFYELTQLYDLTGLTDIDVQSLVKQCAIYELYTEITNGQDIGHPPSSLYTAKFLGFNDEWIHKIKQNYKNAKAQIIYLSKEGKTKEEYDAQVKAIVKEAEDELKNDPIIQIDNKEALLEIYAKVREKYYKE